MDIQLTEEQELLRSSIQRFLRDQYDFDERRKIVATDEGWSRKHWSAFAELGLCAAPFQESSGGLGGGSLATMIVMQEFGRNLVVEPYFETVVLAGGLIEDAGSPEQRAGVPAEDHGRQRHMDAGLGGRAITLRFQQRHHDGATPGGQLCLERNEGGGDWCAVGRQADRLGAYVRWTPRSRRRKPVRRRSPFGQSPLAKLQDHRWSARRRTHADGRASAGQPVAWYRRRRRRGAGGVPRPCHRSALRGSRRRDVSAEFRDA